MTTRDAGDLRLRADAARNREVIVRTARQVYGQRGLNAPLDDIARQAGIGNATLYRHFPNRCSLVAAVFADALGSIIDEAETAMSNPDPWEGFRSHVRFLFRMQATNRGLADLITTQVAGAPQLEDLRDRAYLAFVALADRAKASGDLRPDFTPQDLVLLLIANAGLVHRTASAAPGAWERFSDLALDGLRTAAATSPSAPSPSRRAIANVMQERGHDLGYS